MNRSSRYSKIQVNRWPMKWRRFRPSLRRLRHSFLVDSIPVQMMLRLVRMCCIGVGIVVVVVVADIVVAVVVVVGRNDLGYLNHWVFVLVLFTLFYVLSYLITMLLIILFDETLVNFCYLLLDKTGVRNLIQC